MAKEKDNRYQVVNKVQDSSVYATVLDTWTGDVKRALVIDESKEESYNNI